MGHLPFSESSSFPTPHLLQRFGIPSSSLSPPNYPYVPLSPGKYRLPRPCRLTDTAEARLFTLTSVSTLPCTVTLREIFPSLNPKDCLARLNEGRSLIPDLVLFVVRSVSSSVLFPISLSTPSLLLPGSSTRVNQFIQQESQGNTNLYFR